MNLDEEDSAGESSSKSIYDESLYAGAADAANRATPTSSLKRTNDALLALVKDSASSADVGGESFLEHGAASLGDSPPEDPVSAAAQRWPAPSAENAAARASVAKERERVVGEPPVAEVVSPDNPPSGSSAVEVARIPNLDAEKSAESFDAEVDREISRALEDSSASSSSTSSESTKDGHDSLRPNEPVDTAADPLSSSTSTSDHQEGETKTTLATTEEQPPEDRPLLHQPDDPNEDARWRHFEEATRALLFDDPETEAHRSARVNSLQQRVRDFSKKLSDRHAAEDSAAAAAALQVQETTTTPTLQVDTNAPPGTSSSSTSAVELGKEMQHTQTKQQEEMALAPRRDPKLRDVSREDMKDSWAQVRDSVSDLKDKIKRIGADDATVLGSAQKVRDSLRSAKSHVADMLMQETVDPENPTGEDVGGAQASGGTTTGAAADAQPKGA